MSVVGYIVQEKETNLTWPLSERIMAPHTLKSTSQISCLLTQTLRHTSSPLGGKTPKYLGAQNGSSPFLLFLLPLCVCPTVTESISHKHPLHSPHTEKHESSKSPQVTPDNHSSFLKASTCLAINWILSLYQSDLRSRLAPWSFCKTFQR